MGSLDRRLDNWRHSLVANRMPKSGVPNSQPGGRMTTQEAQRRAVISSLSKMADVAGINPLEGAINVILRREDASLDSVRVRMVFSRAEEIALKEQLISQNGLSKDRLDDWMRENHLIVLNGQLGRRVAEEFRRQVNGMKS